MADFSEPPISLRRELNYEQIAAETSCDANIYLGSFWPNDYSNYQSLVVKTFKACNPHLKYQPSFQKLSDFYCNLIKEKLSESHFDYIVRILGSSETKPDYNRPLHFLAQSLADQISSKYLPEVFFKSSERNAMRYIHRLSGKNVLMHRIQYISSDLFLIPRKLNGCILLLDDIANTGASSLVYTEALKKLCGAEKVVCLNLAITRFLHGKDGKGMLNLDVSDIIAKEWADVVFNDSEKVYHKKKDCIAIKPKIMPTMSFVAQTLYKPCSVCLSKEVSTQKKKWWNIF